MKKLLQILFLFCVISNYGQTPIYHYQFTGNLNSSVGTGTLSYIQGGFTYVPNDQTGGTAIQINNEQTILQANLPNLPVGNSARTVTVRINFNSSTAALQTVFGWGAGAANQAYGYQQSSSNTLNYFWGATDYNPLNAVSANVWYNMSFVYDGTNVTVYKDGLLVGTVVRNLATSGTTFRIGALPSSANASFLHAKIDDLRVYNVALTQSQIQAINTSLNPVAPSVTAISAVPLATTAQINYTLNANNGATSSIIRYGLSSGNLNNQVTGNTASGSANTPSTTTLNSLTPNTTYYYQIEASNGSQAITTSTIQSFTTTPLTVLAEYNFDNSYNNVQGNTPFSSNVGTSFVADRNGNVNSALNIDTYGTFATIPGLPTGSNPRSISLWVKMNVLNSAGYNYLYSYGDATNYNGAMFTWTSLNHFGPPSSTHAANTAVAANTWYHVVIVYDGTNSKIYKNGVLLSTAAKTITTVLDANNSFKLGLTEANGTGYFNGAVDELKIYPYAITDADVTALYSGSTSTTPVISNVAVASLIHEGANISYSVNANGLATETSVIYGKTPAANEVVAPGTAASGTSNTSCTAQTQYNSTPGAAPAGTTMYYKVRASNSAGITDSPIYQYTQVTRPTYEVDAATSITTNSAVVNYNLNPCGGNTTSVLKYGTSLGNYTNTVTGFSAIGFTANYSGVTLSGLLPNTTYYYIVEGTNAYGTSQSSPGIFTTQGTAPVLTNINATAITNNSATINFDLNTGGTSTTTTINYGTSSSNLNISVFGPTVTTNVATPYSVNLPSLAPNTTYYYNVVANGNGVATSNTNSFTTLANPSIPAPVYNFEFNNNLQSQDGSVTLQTPIGGSYSFVSNGTLSNGALQMNDARSQTTLPNLPLGSASRTVHVRLRFASGALSTENFIFNWGTGATGQAFAYHQTASTAKLLGWGGAGYDYASIPSSGANFGQWYEYVFTYNGTAMSVYRDGTLLGTTNATLSTAGDTFRIGVSNSGIQKLQADIDYVRIFNQALDSSQVSLLYANPSLSNTVATSSEMKFKLYPNPADDVVTIAIESEIKLVEIYSLQGQKVLTSTSNLVVVDSLPSGVYFVKVQDAEGKSATQKLVIR